MDSAITSERAVNPQENLLSQILGFAAPAGKAIAEVVNSPGVTPDKFFPGSTVASEALLDQLSILLQRFISLESCIVSRPANYGTQTA
jgi:hypothetical protein